jgi:hypothetical protein
MNFCMINILHDSTGHDLMDGWPITADRAGKLNG